MTFRMIQPARVALTRAFMALVVVVLAGCSFQPDENLWRISGDVFGTQYQINVVLTEDDDRLEELAQGIEKVLEEVDASMSTWREDSELSVFNRQQDQSAWFPVSTALFRVLETSQAISEESGGAFDITIGPVVNLWGFGPDGRPGEFPPIDLLTEVLAATGYANLELNHDEVAIRALSRQHLDLSGIAKGYGVDAVAEYLEGQGVDRYLVEIGGEIRVRGRKPDGSAWRLAVEEPVEGERAVHRVVAMDRYALATSGDYRNYYEVRGQRYSHTIDPNTGIPVDHRLASVTVITTTAMEADGWATAFTVLGYEEAMALATRKNMAAYFIIRDGDEFRTDYTPAFATYLIQ